MISRPRSAALAGLFVLGGMLAACSAGDAKSASSPDAGQAAAATKAPATGASAATPAATQAAAAAAAGPAEGVGVSLAEFSLSGTSSVRAGKVTFEVSNSGMLPHNVYVVKSDAALTALPQKDGQVDVTKVQVVAKTADINPGDKDLRVDATLTPGRYLMFCNVLGHYQSGMVKQLTVQ